MSYLTFNYYSKMAQFTYRTAFISAAVTYGIVVYKAFRARSRAAAKPQQGVMALAADENVQYLGKSGIPHFRPHAVFLRTKKLDAILNKH